MVYPHAIVEKIRTRMITFMDGLHESGMAKKRILELTFDFTLLLFEAEEEKGLKAGQHLSPSVKAELMEISQQMLTMLAYQYTSTWE